MALERISHSGVAPTTGVQTGFNATALTFTILSGTGYPTGSNGPFYLKIDGGTTSEEMILCSGLSGTTVTVASGGRGRCGTSPTSHSAGMSNVEHDFSEEEADDNNDHVYTTSRDDHTQYLRVDGTRGGTGPQTLGPITVVSTGANTFNGSISAAAFYWTGSGEPIGTLLGSSEGPPSQTDFTTGSTVVSQSFGLTNGYKYMVSATLFIATQVTTGGQAQVYLTDTAGYLPTSGGTEVRVFAGSLATSEQVGGGASFSFTATSTASDTITVTALTSAGAFRIPANCVQLNLVRVG